RSRFVIRIQSDPDLPAFRFDNPVDYWNSLYFNLYSLPERRRHIVRYEDMLGDHRRVLRTIAERFAIPCGALDIELPDREVRRVGDQESIDSLGDREFTRAQWYRNRGFLDAFDSSQRAFVQSRLDLAVVKDLGYQYVLAY